MRIALAVVVALHGIAHIVGFLGSLPAGTLKDFTYRTAVFGGRLDVGEAGIRLFGWLWLAVALTFVVVAGLAIANRPGWVPLAFGITAVSCVFCAIGWPDAKFGIIVNAAIALTVLLGTRAGGFLVR